LQSVHLEYFCTNSQAEYEAILLGLQILISMGVKHVKAFGDLLLVVQKIASIFQCLDGSLNAYLDKCLEIIALSDYFIVQHISRDENTMTNDLAQKHQVFDQIKENSVSRKNRMFRFTKSDGPIFGRCAVQQSVVWDQVQKSRTVQFLKLEGPKILALRTN
jgi:ribonuclease HI